MSGVNVDLKAETNANVSAPVVAGNTIKDLTFNYSAGAEEKQREEQELLKLNKFLKSHKINMKKKAKHIFEGKKENKANLEEVYTEVFMTEGDIEVNCEHEIRKIDDAFKTKKSLDRPISCNEIFKSVGEENQKIILTKGIAGIGKTVSVQKFILDWAEEKDNQKIDAIFLFSFRQINQIKDKSMTFHEFLQEFFPEMKQLEKTDVTKLTEKYKVAFIFDGLDESRLPLDFDSRPLTNIHEKKSVDKLFINLVRGDLLPSSLIWITSRPTANQIPPQYIHLFTVVRGFTDQQKEEYFRKRFKEHADKIIKHLKRSRSLYIMCHIPVFCWITATLLTDIFIKNNEENIDNTLTEMYIHFLVIQINMMSQKYDEKPERERKKLLKSKKTILLKLARLAFEQLKKESIIFYEEDLEECGIDVSADSEYTGMIIEIFEKESVLHETKVFSFVHMSVQEFLAALHVFICYITKKLKDLEFFFSREPSSSTDLDDILIKVIDKAQKSERGHLDLFLRFLMGISLESSQKLLKGLLTHTEDTTKSIKETTEYITKIHSKVGEKTLVSLFHCLLEVKDQLLCEEIRRYLHPDSPHSVRDLSSTMCTLIICELSVSEKVLDEFNIRRYNTSQEDCERLIPVVKYCRKAVFGSCGLTERCCESLFSCLQSSDSPLRELDLSNNDLQNSRVKLISDALNNSNCKLEILRLSSCNLTAECCEIIASALKSSNSALRDLDLSNNDLQDSGVKLISDALKSHNCKLQILRLSGCMVTEKGCDYLDSALSSKQPHMTELDLSYNHPQDSKLKKNYKLKILNVDHDGEFRIKAGPRKWICDLTLDPNTAFNYFVLSEENRKVTYVRNSQSYPDHEDRFDNYDQVLSRESLTEHCYWEVEWSGSNLYVSVSYKSITRKGGSVDTTFGANEKSWILQCYGNTFAVWHKNNKTNLPAPSSHSNRVGVYVDREAGTLSYYSVSDTDTLTHLYTFNTTFTEPLYAGFKLFNYDTSVYLCKIK